MTEADDLTDKFVCIGQVGDRGHGSEVQVGAAMAAVDPAMNMPGACNEGFIRRDALLVLVLITDEDDGDNCVGTWCTTGTPGLPQDWFDEIVASKGGRETNVAVVSLLWGMTPNVCGPRANSEHPGAEIKAFTDLFTHGFVGDVCAPDYSPLLHEAVSVIDVACDGFVPPG